MSRIKIKPKNRTRNAPNKPKTSEAEDNYAKHSKKGRREQPPKII